jgi:hypothetical protein
MQPHAHAPRWFRYVTDGDSPLDAGRRARVALRFVVTAGAREVEDEAARHGDVLAVDAPEGYEHLWRKARRGGGSGAARRQRRRRGPPPDRSGWAADRSRARPPRARRGPVNPSRRAPAAPRGPRSC